MFVRGDNPIVSIALGADSIIIGIELKYEEKEKGRRLLKYLYIDSQVWAFLR